MFIYLLTNLDKQIGFDSVISAVVCAENKDKARLLMSGYSEDEKPETWLNPEYSTCVLIGYPMPDISERTLFCKNSTGG